VVELFVAPEPRRGWRGLRVEADHKAATWGQFVARQMDTTYRDAKKVRWVMDHLSTHKLRFCYAHFPPAVAQADLRRMEIIYTPAHGAWLNMAEIEFSVLSRQVLDQPFTTSEQVRRVVEQWQDRQNARPKPRNGQFKTADARLKLAKLYPTI